jgi:hypothetical protein
MSKIVMITSSQPALNPRLVKEADALTEAGHEVTVIYAYWNQWGHQFSKGLLAGKSWTALCAGGDPEADPMIYWCSKITFKLSRLLMRLTGQTWLAEWAIGRPGLFLTRMAARQAADLYIGHNLAALPATVIAAGKQQRPCGFDAEDLHRYEMSADPTDPDVLLKSFIENKYIPQLQYLTVSSPLIGAAYQELFPVPVPRVVRNVFPKSNVQPRPLIRPAAPLRLFWFSQTLGSQRGLQDIAGALSQLPVKNFEWHLLCDQPVYTQPFKNELLASGINIRFYDPIPADQVVAFAAQFDIGMATEPGFSINNDLALSNKLFTYLQAGLFIVATATAAQQAFMAQYPDVGRIYQPGNIPALAALLDALESDRTAVDAGQRAALALAHTAMNWETEKHVFLATVNQVIHKP